MANCNKQFLTFNDSITLTTTQEENLRRGRDSLRDEIKQYYKDKNLNQPQFCGQGSFAMRTTIQQDGEDYDLDDGIYVQHLPENKSDWPKTEVVHAEIIEAVKNHTTTPPLDKHACVRVQYKNDYHIDLAIYAKNDDKTHLARKGSEQWEENDPNLFDQWFHDKLETFGEQYRRLCKYIKKWSYYNGYSDEITGFLISTLVGNNISTGDDNDDSTLAATLDKIVTNLKQNRCITRPVEPHKNMTKKFPDDEFQKKFIDRFSEFSTKAKNAVDASTEKESCDIWISLFGSDFPESNESVYDRSFSTNITEEVHPWGN
jgi:hypothetical protein